MHKSIRFSVALWAGLLFGVGVAQAQGVSTTGQVRGRVQDDLGAPAAGAVVVARNVATGFQRETRTSQDGLYFVRLLPPGTYNVTTRMIGFQPTTAQGVRVTIGAAVPVNFSLVAAAVVLEPIEIAAGAVQINVAEGGFMQLVSQQQIEDLPSLGRDFVDFIELSGLVAPDPGETTGGQFSIGGQRPSQTSLQIDGVDANNSFFGENRGGSRIPFVFSLESIREFQIITNGFDVEYGSFGGGIVNVVTRGGANNFEGSVFANFRGDFLTARPFIEDASNPEITTDYEVQQFGGRVSGAIIRDRAHFLISGDAQRRREPQLPLTRSQFAPGGADEDAVAFDEIGRFFQIMEDQYGVANVAQGYNPFSTTADAVTLFGRIDWTLSPNHRLTLRHNYSNFSNDREWNGVFDREYGLSRAEELKDRSHSFVTELQSQLGQSTFNVFRFQFSDEKRPRQGNDLRPTITVNLSNGRRIRYGGSFASYNNNLEETKIQIIDNLSRVAGNHTFKLGGSFMNTHYLNQFQFFGSQFQGAGEFIFSGLDDLEAFRPSSYFRPIQQGGGVPTSEFDVVEWSVYAQDAWQVTPKLSATLGLRYDQQSFRDSPTPVVEVEQAFGFETGFAPTDNNNFSPRLALAYDLNGDGRSVLRGGVGYFYGRVPGVVGGNVLQTERPILEVICGGSIVDGDPDAPPSPADYGTWSIDGLQNPSTCAAQEAGGVPTFNFWNRGFSFPETIKANVGYETLIGDRTQLSLDVLFSQTQNLYTVRNLNLRDVQFQLAGEANRRIFTPAGVFDPTGANANGSRRNLEFGQVLANFTDGRSRAVIVNFEAAHNFSRNFNVAFSYTYTQAYDNSPYTCCTASGGFAAPTVGVFGPNEIGDFGDSENSWGRSDFGRVNAFVATVFAKLPLDVAISAVWKSQSGRPWSVVGDDDLNGDGVTGNDRIFVFSPANLPLASTGTAADDERAVYSSLLQEHSCVGDFTGQIIERNTCTFPWTHLLNVRLSRRFNTVAGQRAELQLEFFNVLNGIGRLLCDEDDPAVDPTSGVCGLGRITGVFGSNQELLEPSGFDATNGQILYTVNEDFGQEDLLGANLVLQFQLQLAFRYFF